MSRIIKTWRDPYDEGFSTCRRKEVTLNPGVTALVGYNGAGKSTMLHNIEARLKTEKITVFSYNNESESKISIGDSLLNNDVTLAATQMCSSEGENISINFGKIASKLMNFIKKGDDGDKLAKIFEEESKINTNERWILLDAMDSGYSINNVMEMKNFFNFVLEDAKKQGKTLYIVISSNEYELVDGMNYLDVMEGKHVTFENYKKIILHTRKKKNKRYKK